MIPYSSLAIITLAALVHASFQLSVSVLTLLSGHAMGKQTALRKLQRLIGSFIAGVGIMTLLLLSTITLVLQVFFGTVTPILAWAIASGLLLGLGVAVWSFYYRRGQGTSLWLPRGFARFLDDRTKATHHSPESFSLGMASVVAEILFVFAPLLVSALVIVELPALWQSVALALYTVVSLLSIATVGGLICSGHKISSIQQWRENNKRFIQFAGGGGLLVLGAYVYVNFVIGGTLL